LLPVETRFTRRKLHLGYRRVTWRRDMGFAARGTTSWGHEYHDSTLDGGDEAALADVVDGEGNPLPPAGHAVGHVTGTYFHAIA
jgi:cobyrinic acid a,c-diamide synthase